MCVHKFNNIWQVCAVKICLMHAGVPVHTRLVLRSSRVLPKTARGNFDRMYNKATFEATTWAAQCLSQYSSVDAVLEFMEM